MSQISPFQDLGGRLQQAAERAGVPGAAVAVRWNGRTEVAAAGVRAIGDPTPVTCDTLFPIGCVMKSVVARMAASLQVRGLLDLDAAVVDAVPEFAAVDPARTITLRRLLSHTSGLDENPLIETGEGPDRISEYLNLHIQAFAGAPPLAAPGRFFSYSAAGYVIAAGVMERATGLQWDALVQAQLADALGVRLFFGRPDPGDDAATEHFARRSAALVAANIYYPPCLDPAGTGRTWSSVGDLIRVVTGMESAVEALVRKPHVDVGHWVSAPELYGLGHFMSRSGLVSLIGFGHGSRAEATLAPQGDLAIVVAANAAVRGVLFPELRRELAEAAGVAIAPEKAAGSQARPGGTLAEASAYAGVYERFTARLEVSPGDDGLAAQHFTRLRRGAAGGQPVSLSRHAGDDFNAGPNAAYVRTVSFLSEDPAGGFTHARVNGQLFRRRVAG